MWTKMVPWAYAIYEAHVRNHAKLAYNSFSDWLDGNGFIQKQLASNRD